MDGLKDKRWWAYLEEDLQELINQSILLSQMVVKWRNALPEGSKEFHDYAFIVFPAAKAYEGFLKKLFLDLKFITEDDYYGKRFRVGKSLNPALERKYYQQSVYNKLVDYCKGKDLANTLWETWRVSRNLVFHWFPNEKRALTFNEANERVEMIINSMDRAFEECKIN